METHKAASYSCVSVEYILRWYGCISWFVWIYYRCKAWFIQSFVMPFVDGEAFQYNLGSWFVYPLFLVCIINVLFRKFLKLIHLDNEFIVLIVYLAIGMIGINTAIENPTAINGIVKLFVRTMFFLPCYEFGRFYKAVLERKTLSIMLRTLQLYLLYSWYF